MSKSEDRRLASELQFHVEGLVRDYIAAGMDPAEARRRARMEFGGRRGWIL